MKYFIPFVCTAFLVIGCSSSLTPPIKEYTILPSDHPVKVQAPLSLHTLSIASSKTLPSLSSKSLYYLKGDGESGAYLYSRWSDTPAVLIQHSLTASLQENRVFASLLPQTSSAHADWILESELNSFYHRFPNNRKSEGFIDITYRLVDTSTKLPLGTKRFVITVDAPTDDAKGGVNALTQATEKLSIQVIAWITTLAKEKK